VQRNKREGPLAEVRAIACEPRPADDGAPTRKDLVDDWRVDVTAVDVERIDGQTLRRDVRDQTWGRLLLGAIGWEHCDRQDEQRVEVDREMALVAIEAQSDIPYCASISADRVCVLLYVHGSGDSGSPRVTGSTSRSSFGQTSGCNTSTAAAQRCVER
jgi:hypothetical protein